MANREIKLIEIARSFSRKISNPNNKYENMDYFCSAKKEIPESQAEEVSEELFKFCEGEVMKSVGEYGMEHLPAEKTEKVEEKKEPSLRKSNRGWEAKSDTEEEEKKEINYNEEEKEQL